MDRESLYADIALRTGGDIYIGVVGPVRTGKSTFIRRFMEQLVLPGIQDANDRQRATDELPVGGAGKTIMTTQPRFVPNEAVNLPLAGGGSARVRLVDCVGYLINGAMGLEEEGGSRMVRTPWFDHDIPFEQAAETGTRKVIFEHATLGVVVTTDGSVSEFPRSAYLEAESRVIGELKSIGKPFVIVLNSLTPGAEETLALRRALGEKYDARVIALNCQDMNAEQALSVLNELLYEFPIVEARLFLPGWVCQLPDDHYIVSSLLHSAREAAESVSRLFGHEKLGAALRENEYLQGARLEEINPSDGSLSYRGDMKEGLFYQVLGEMSGQAVEGEEHLMRLMTEMVSLKGAYERVAEALRAAELTGYGVVEPAAGEMRLEKPELTRAGGRYGVRLRAGAPSMHLIRVDAQTEVNPIVGTESQAEELVNFLNAEFESDPEGVWGTKLFGKTVYELMREGLNGKLSRLNDESREKLREGLTKIVNEGGGGMICILL